MFLSTREKISGGGGVATPVWRTIGLKHERDSLARVCVGDFPTLGQRPQTHVPYRLVFGYLWMVVDSGVPANMLQHPFQIKP